MEYEVVMGLETHVELSSKTKIFCSCTSEFGGEVNGNCCPICLGMPGTLPKLNKTAVEYVLRAGLATNCKINQHSYMDRKNYVYPDLSKAYQVSQDSMPFCVNGYVELDSGKKIRIERIHLEEDAGKLVHKQGEIYLDANRGGVCLIEIVTQPDFRAASEVREYLEKLQTILRYIDVSDARMEEGSLRCDVNISLRKKGSEKLGVRAEIKNMNSFTFIDKAIEYETERQEEALKNNEKLIQETRKYIQELDITEGMREKEDVADYRYFPEPDLAAINTSDEEIERIRKQIPELPEEKVEKYLNEYKISEVDADILLKYKKIADYFEEASKDIKKPAIVANFLLGQIFSKLESEAEKEEGIKFPAKYLNEMVRFIEDGTISNNMAKNALEEMLEKNLPITEVLTKEDMTSVDEGDLIDIVKKAVESSEKAVEDIKAGRDKAIGAIIGKVMKETKGKADPQRVDELIKEIIG